MKLLACSIIALVLVAIGPNENALAEAQDVYCQRVKQKIRQCRKRAYYQDNKRPCRRASEKFALACTNVDRARNDSPASGICLAIYQPVCGQPPYSCPAGRICATVMPQPKTYSNRCVLTVEKATLLHPGECKSSDS